MTKRLTVILEHNNDNLSGRSVAVQCFGKGMKYQFIQKLVPLTGRPQYIFEWDGSDESEVRYQVQGWPLVRKYTIDVMYP